MLIVHTGSSLILRRKNLENSCRRKRKSCDRSVSQLHHLRFKVLWYSLFLLLTPILITMCLYFYMCVHCNILYGRPLTYEVFLRCHYKCSTSHYTARNTTNAIFFTLLKFAGFICFPRSRFPVFASFNSFKPVWPHCTHWMSHVTLSVTCATVDYIVQCECVVTQRDTECYMGHCVTTGCTLTPIWRAIYWARNAHHRFLSSSPPSSSTSSSLSSSIRRWRWWWRWQWRKCLYDCDIISFFPQTLFPLQASTVSLVRQGHYVSVTVIAPPNRHCHPHPHHYNFH